MAEPLVEQLRGSPDGGDGPAAGSGNARSNLLALLENYRETRAVLERQILPLATSLDGHGFDFQASLHALAVRPGGYVVVGVGDQERLGLVTDVVQAVERADMEGLGSWAGDISLRLARGHGVLVEAAVPFHDATIRPASPETVAERLSAREASWSSLVIGERLYAPGVPVALDATGLSRHTFMCGQSGSGKTYALGVLLEEILAKTSLPVVVLDPNSDFVRLHQLRGGTGRGVAEGYARAFSGVTVWSADHAAHQPLRVRFGELHSSIQAEILELDPIRDREEYALLAESLRGGLSGRGLIGRLEDLVHSGDRDSRQLGLRAANLGVMDWTVWDPKDRSLVEEIAHPRSRCIVVDVGSLDSPAQQQMIAATVLLELWQNRHRRQPCLIVMDEAHNVCPVEPANGLQRLSAQICAQIAGEGRKFGLYLLAASQRPHKLNLDVMSQCDNLMLMRMNSQTDVTDLAHWFSYIPSGLIHGCLAFQQGEALVGGRFLREPTYTRIGRRVTREGGADVPTSWAHPDR